MPIILETPEFVVNATDKPHHSRENGGHIVVWPQQEFAQLHDMPLELATALNILTMVVGEAFMSVAKSNGLDAVRVNYANFGNWNYKEPVKDPKTHINLYLRTWGEKHPDNDPRFMPFPDALYLPDRKTGYYDHFMPLTDRECAQIKEEILRLLTTDKYQNVQFTATPIDNNL